MTKKEVINLSNNEIDRVVKIQGTKFDRKVKVSPNMEEKMKYLRACGYSLRYIADAFGVSTTTVKYHIDPAWRSNYNYCRSGEHTGTDHYTKSDRAEYKRKLVLANANVVYPKV